MMRPEEENNHEGAIAFLHDACQTIEMVEGEDHVFRPEQVLNWKRVWWKTLTVTSNRLGEHAKNIEDLESMARDAHNFMHRSRADVLKRQILESVENYRLALDSKSSESVRDSHNATTTMMEKLLKNKQERVITVKDEIGRSLKDSIIGKEANQQNN